MSKRFKFTTLVCTYSVHDQYTESSLLLVPVSQVSLGMSKDEL